MGKWEDWFAAPRPQRDESWIIALPFAGGGAHVFARWPRALGRKARLLTPHMPGRPPRAARPAATSIEEIAAPLAEVLAEAAGGAPPTGIVLYGHSFGALIAFELGHGLKALGHVPDRIVMAGPPWPGLTATATAAAPLPDGLAADFGAALEADIAAVRRWAPPADPRPAAPLTILASAEDEIHRGALLACARYSAEGFRYRQVPGGHMVFHERPEDTAALVAAETGLEP